ncbi:Uncharacterized protein Adt_21265 [Abeliophyllum distichum]|uniref:Uncharacterized protein n=1 Tax=Abeliophyllum distichum TaxID=126358 RepID=A0ABD1SYU9_9LAMI
MKDSSENVDDPTLSVVEKTDLSSANIVNENLNVDAETGNIVAKTNNYRLFLQILVGSMTPEFDLTGSLLEFSRSTRESEIIARIRILHFHFHCGVKHSKMVCPEGYSTPKVSMFHFENFPYYKR